MFLLPAPLYHSAPLIGTLAVQRLGATVVVMERFDAEECLRLIGRHRVTHAQFVPTMFVRLLRLPEDVRHQYDVSSLEVVQHGAAPCPVPVKRQMIDWWGPIIHEYYGGTEEIGWSGITSEEWLAHPGSVGRPVQECHIVGDDGEEVPAGQPGLIYFDGGRRSSTTTTGTRRRRSPTTRGGGRSATSATSTRTATSSSPTARPT